MIPPEQARALLAAIEHELAEALAADRSRLWRLRVLLLAALHTDLPLPDALAQVVEALDQKEP